MTGYLAERESPSVSPDSPRTAPGRVSTEAAGKLRAIAEEDGCKASISVNGGPQIPFDKAHEAQIMQEIAPAVARGMAAAGAAKKLRPGGIAADQLRSVIQRLERLHEEKDGIASDIKDLFAECKGNGFDVPTLRKILKLRAMDAAERDEAQHLLDTSLRAIGMQADLFENTSEGD